MYQAVSQYAHISLLCTFALFSAANARGEDQPLDVQEQSVGSQTDEPSATQGTHERAVILRFSKSLFQPGEAGKIDHQSDVNRVVLGTKVVGKSRTVGDVRVDLLPNDDSGSFQMVFKGSVNARTVGRNGPATIHSTATTHFECVKKVVFDLENGFHSEPSVVRTQTQLVNDKVSLPNRGLLGRVARNIATRRIQASQPEATRFTNEENRRDIGSGFDKVIDEQLESLNKNLDMPRLLAAAFGTVTKNDYCVRSRDDYLEICFHDFEKPISGLTFPHDQVPDSPVEIWVRTSFFEPKLRTAIQAYAFADNVQEWFPVSLLQGASSTVENGLTSSERQQVESQLHVVDGWFVFRLSAASSLVSLAGE